MSYAFRVLRLTLTRVRTLNRNVDANINDTCQLLKDPNVLNSRFYCTEVLAHPTPSNMEKQYPQKIVKIAEEITKLTLIEVNDLNSLLMKTLNIRDTPMMAYGAMPAAAQAPAEEEEEVKAVKSSFTVRLTKYTPDKKIALIKEIKSIIEGMNLVQAKKFVEEVPQVIKGDISKDEAEALKKSLEAVGGECDIE